MSVQQQFPPDDGGVRRKQLLPAQMAEDDHRPPAALVIGLQERPSPRRAGTEHLEETTRHEHPANSAAIDTRSNAPARGGDVHEHTSIAAQRFEVGWSERDFV